jgi:hypothetical protein
MTRFRDNLKKYGTLNEKAIFEDNSSNLKKDLGKLISKYDTNKKTN